MNLDGRLRRLERAAGATDVATLTHRKALAINAFLLEPPEDSIAALRAIGPSPARDYFLVFALEMETNPAT